MLKTDARLYGQRFDRGIIGGDCCYPMVPQPRGGCLGGVEAGASQTIRIRMERASHFFKCLLILNFVPCQPSGTQKENVTGLEVYFLRASNSLEQPAIDRNPLGNRKPHRTRLHVALDIEQDSAA